MNPRVQLLSFWRRHSVCAHWQKNEGTGGAICPASFQFFFLMFTFRVRMQSHSFRNTETHTLPAPIEETFFTMGKASVNQE